MFNSAGLILLFIVAALLIGVFWRADDALEEAEADDDAGEDRIVAEIEAAQRLRREAEQTTDPDERARLLRFADEAESTIDKIKQGVLSDQ